jgi:hypothetical protein
MYFLFLLFALEAAQERALLAAVVRDAPISMTLA